MPGDSGVLVVTRVRSTTTKCTRDRGCSGHPAFPTPSKGAKHFINGSDALRRGITKDVGKPVDPIRYRLVGSRGSRIRAIVICPALGNAAFEPAGFRLQQIPGCFLRHCERSEAIQKAEKVDCFV